MAPGDVDESLSDGEQTRCLHELEDGHDLLVYLADAEPSSWTERCLRQADRVVLVADADGDSALTGGRTSNCLPVRRGHVAPGSTSCSFSPITGLSPNTPSSGCAAGVSIATIMSGFTHETTCSASPGRSPDVRSPWS